MQNPTRSILMALTCGLPATLPVQAQEPKTGSTLKPLVTLHGRQSMVTEPHIVRITSGREWQALWREHHLGKSKEATGEYAQLEFDFNRVMVIAVFQGKGMLCEGYDVDSITEAKDRLTLRVRLLSYQLLVTEESYKHLHSRAWGVFVLPRSDKQIVLEKDESHLVGAPPIWKKWTTIPAVEPTRNR